MTMPYDVPGYVQGYRFSDDPLYYDSTRQAFRDLAGFGQLADMTITAGAPVFDTINGVRCLKLDNTFHGSCRMPVPWQGSMIAVVKPTYTGGGTLTRELMLFGDNATPTANSSWQLKHFSGQRLFIWRVDGGSTSRQESVLTDDPLVFGAAHDQETRKSYTTLDGTTINERTAAGGTTNGNALSMTAAVSGIRFGDLDGDPANLAAITDLYAHMFEVHFFRGNIWRQYPSEAAAVVAALKSKYGVA